MTEKFLEGRVALVTGGASGMGKAMALALAGAGAKIAIGSLLAGGARTEGEVSYLPGQAELDAAKAEIEALGAPCLALGLDVTDEASMKAFAQATEAAYGKIDILAHAAGITAEQTIVGHSDGLWNKVVEVNLTGSYRAIKHVLPGMIQREWGRIVCIASTAASVGAETSAAYCASKAGVVGLMRCVAPTWVNTDFGRDWMGGIGDSQDDSSAEKYIADVRSANPQGRLIEPSEVGALALYLCRDEAQGMTMQDLTLSAGSVW
jgi:NAD(P)-dependent dehydrogenase (short-subunit alcohol dehydrogenase family)